MPEALLLFVAAAFILPTEPAYGLVFYVTIPALLLWRRPSLPWRDAAFALGMAVIIWSGLTLLWGIDDGHRTWRFALATVSTFVFMAVMAEALREQIWRQRLAWLLAALGMANAIFAIILFVITHPVFPRMHGWGATSHVILGAAVMATAYLTALYRFLIAPRERWWCLPAAIVMGVFILMTESRGPILAAGLCTIFLCLAGAWRGRATLALAAAALIWWLLPRAAQKHGAAVLMRRGTSHRFEIWTHTLRLIADRPLFGHGLADNIHVYVPDEAIGNDITFPHDLYLGVLFYSGAVGFALFAALIAVLAWRLWRARANAETPWLAALGLNALLAGLTDLGQITKGPGTLWFILWLPIGLIAASTRSPARERP